MTFTDLPILILLYLVVLYFSIWIHELGHAVMGRAAGFTITSLGNGHGRPFCVIPVGGAKIYFGRVRPFGGVTFAYMPQIYPSKRQFVLYMAGGFLANALVAVGAVGLYWGFQSSWDVVWIMIAAVNGLVFVTSLLPVQVRVGVTVMRTDGLWILLVLRTGTFGTSGPMLIQTLRHFHGLWTSIGDTIMLRVYLMAAAATWAELGERESAETLSYEAEALPDSGIPSLEAYCALLSVSVATVGERPDDAAKALDRSEFLYRSLGHDLGVYFAKIVRSHRRLIRGDASGALADLDALDQHPLADQHPQLVALRLSIRVHAQIAQENEAEVARLWARYRTLSPSHRFDIQDLGVSTAVARFYARRDQWAEAKPAYEQAMTALGRVADAWSDQAERVQFLDRRAELVAEAQHCLESLGQTDEAATLIRKFEPKPVVDPLVRNRRLRRIALRLMLVNVVMLCFAIMSFFFLLPTELPKQPPVSVLFGLQLLLFTAVGAVYLLVDVALARFSSLLRQSSGAILLFFATMPWLGGLMAVVMAMVGP